MSRLRFVSAAFALSLTLATVAVTAAPQSSRPAPNPIYDIVAVGRRPGEIVLATPALGGSNHWRFRRISVAPKTAEIESTVLARSGTKLLLVFQDGTPRIVDLTTGVVGISESVPLPALHRLPGQLFPVEHAGRACIVDDALNEAERECRDAARVAFDGGGRVLYAAPDGTLFFLVQLGANGIGLPQYRIPSGARYEIVSGLSGDPYQFLVLVAQGKEARIVNPVRPDSPLGAYPTWELASLRAMLELAGSTSGEDARLQALARNLVRESGASFQWSFFRVKPDLSLYAPVLEFAPNETAFPSDVNIWDVINPHAKGFTREDYQAVYDTLGDQRWKRCTVYYRVTSYPGSWLLEYWYYYPFDEGKPHRHVHDSEHVFIEVDKLGGAVRSYVASDHGSFAPNNGYSTLLPGAQPVTLPLFAMVELDKHAMSPDIDRDGKFTRGVDENLYPMKYEAWGVRDIATQPQHLLKSYKPSMTLSRRVEDRLAMRNAAQYFPGLDVPQGRDVCGLAPLPAEPSPTPAAASPPTETGANPSATTVKPCKDCVVANAQTAMRHLLDHPDSQHPTAIYKTWVLPYRQLRLGVAPFDHNANHDQLYAAYVLDIPHLTRNVLPVPGRVAFEAMWSPSSHPDTLTASGHTRTGTISSEMYIGARYEGFFSHTQGYYFGVTPQFRRFTAGTLDGVAVPHSTEWQYNEVWYRAGYLFELPSRVHGNMTHHVGVVFNRSLVRMEWRISFGMLRQRGRNHFGLSPSAPSP